MKNFCIVICLITTFLYGKELAFNPKKELFNYTNTNFIIIHNGTQKIIFRTFYQEQNLFGIALNPKTYTSEIINITQNIKNQNKNSLHVMQFYKFLKKYTQFISLVNSGITHSFARDDKKIYLTMDMCPSSKIGFEKNFLVELSKLDTKKPLPLAIAITSRWIKTHKEEFLWIIKEQQKGTFRITWFNHTRNHHFNPNLPLERNFLLLKNTNLDEEILELEKTLLRFGQTPSIFVRFPGLVANKSILKAMQNRYLLLPIGSKTWLAKGQKIKKGSIILVHGNLNEHSGIVSFLNFLHTHPKIKFGDIRSLFVK